jgi:predicted alpha/beta hydrolase family esterase
MKPSESNDHGPRTALLLSSATEPYPNELSHFRDDWVEDVIDLRLHLEAGRHGSIWAVQIDSAVRNSSQSIIVVAQGEACLALAHWAQLSPSSYTAAIAGALFHLPSAVVATAAAESPRSSPKVRLPFASILLSDTGQIEPVLELADIWGSRFIDASAQDSAYRSDLRGGQSAGERSLLALLFGDDGGEAVGGVGSRHPVSRRVSAIA